MPDLIVLAAARAAASASMQFFQAAVGAGLSVQTAATLANVAYFATSGLVYAAAFAAGADRDAILRPHVEAARTALDLGLGVNAGHDLNLLNLPDYAAAVPGLQEVSIGHAFTVDALRLGIAATVRAYQRALGKAA